jgi:7,8-dihydro-6-hydroxymethylpterin-pyrophosphokinase
MTTEQLAEAVRLQISEGDIIFVNAESIDIGSLTTIWPVSFAKNFMIIPITVPQGQTVQGCLTVMTRELVKNILEAGEHNDQPNS